MRAPREQGGGTIDGLDVREADDVYCIALWRNAVLSAWREGATPPRVMRLREAVRESVSNNPDGVVVVLRLGAALPIPEGEARSVVVDLMRRFDAQLLGWMIVMEGEGFRAAAARTVASTVRLLARGSFPLKISATVSEGASWVAQYVPGATTLDVHRALDRVSASIQLR